MNIRAPLLALLLLAPTATAADVPPRDAVIQDFLRTPNGTVPTAKFTGEVRAFTLEVHEVERDIAPNVKVRQWAFSLPGGTPSVPGPELRAKVGDLVRVTLRNTTARAHTIHLHGINSLAQEMDGVPHTSRAVLPGESFTYEFVATEAGSFMYHCHVETNLHLDMGMYGAVVIEPKEPRAWTKEHVLMLDEWDSRQDPDVTPHRATPNYFLVNGVAYPFIPDLAIPNGEVHLLRFMNIGSEVHSMHLHGTAFLVIAKDGQDLAVPYKADTVLLGPGERYDVLVKGRDGTFPLHDHIPPHGTNDGIDPGGMHFMVVGGPALNAQGEVAPDHAHDHAAPEAPLPELRSGTVDVTMSGFKFSAPVLRVKRGTKVVWTNADLAAHALIVKGPKEASSWSLGKGGRFAVTFDVVGTYDVQCGPHPSMTMRVLVED